MKNILVAYILCVIGFFTGIMGLHRFYLNKTGSGIAQLLTFGGLGIWQFIDLFLIPDMVKEANLTVQIPTQNINQNTNQNNIIINIVKDEINTTSKNE